MKFNDECILYYSGLLSMLLISECNGLITNDNTSILIKWFGTHDCKLFLELLIMDYDDKSILSPTNLLCLSEFAARGYELPGRLLLILLDYIITG